MYQPFLLIRNMGTNNRGGPFTRLTVPKALKYARILVLIELTRFLGLNLFLGIKSDALTADTALYAVGDALVAASSIPAWYGLRRPGVKRYGLVIVWVAFGLTDLTYAVVDGILSGQSSAIFSSLGPGIVAVPLNINVQLAMLALLFSRSVSMYMTRQSTM